MKEAIEKFVLNALQEDVGDGDHTSLACVPADAKVKAKLLVKENGILAGIDLAKEIFRIVDPTIAITTYLNDGASIKIGDIAFEAAGSAQKILVAERLVLNCMQRMSGIATQTAAIVKKLEGTSTQVLDTRKTTPGLRLLEKWAVRIGGGVNHRIGLFDMIMIKDNHVDYAGGIQIALEKTRKYLSENKKDLKIEIEVRNFNELNEVLEVGGADRIMLDNFEPEELKKALVLIDGEYETEASGGITIDTIRAYAETGVDYISVGALTHSVKGLDLSLKAIDA